MAGYSGTPLYKKLGIKPGTRLALLRAPAGWAVPDLPDGVEVGPAEGADTVVAFHRSAAELADGIEALERLSEADLDKPVTGRVPPFVKRAGDCFVTVGSHWSSHTGQWVVLRRKLGRPRMF